MSVALDTLAPEAVDRHLRGRFGKPYLYEPDQTPNPLAGGGPHPGAAYVRWALGMVGVESAPGALDEFDAPEHFWAAANYWYRQYEDESIRVSISLTRSIADPAGKVSLPPKK